MFLGYVSRLQYDCPGENGFLNDLGLDSSMFGPCHADELYLMWNPYWFNNYTLNKVTSLTSNHLDK